MRVIILLGLLILPLRAFAQRDLTRYVNPFIGTGGHGHTFPGAIVPFGMVQLSPDTRLTGWDGCSGYHYSDSKIYGFSHTHLSGTGISDYGDILLMPTINGIDMLTPLKYASRFQHRNETASPGYYSVKLDDDKVFVELTATARVGMHRYTFPATTEAHVVLDLDHRDDVIDSSFKIIDDTRIVGWRRSKAWAKDQIVYFALEFSQPFTGSGSIFHEFNKEFTEFFGPDLKAYFTFDTRSGRPLLVKVGISSVDVEGAQQNLRAEINDWDFDKVKADAKAAWNRELNKIAIDGGTNAQLTNFYTALYHAMTAPNLFMDVDGRYRGRDFKIHKADDFSNYTVFSLWDTFRAAHPLYNIIDQKRSRDFIRTFLVQYEQGGRLPVWELAANETDTMIGYHAVSVIADAAAKHIGGFDLNKAYEAMKHSAELRQHGGLGAYIDQGFISMEDERESVSKVLEYAYDDWCIAEVARMLGRTADYERYNARAQSYKNVYDSSSGFMRPRSNGNWLEPFDPREVTFGFTEANSWQYTFFAPHDISGLIGLMGGRRQFAEKLDQLFAADSRTTGREQADITGLIGQYAHGNEPSHHMAYLYNYVGQPWKTQARVRQIMDQFYKPDPDGLIGNEDCGQMSAWYVLNAAGFYPVTPGSTVYAIGSPLFPEVRFNLENGKSFVVRGVGVSERNVYVQSATLNGRPYNKSFLMHRDLLAGGELVFRMGPRPNFRWGTGTGNEPVSRIAGRKIVPVPVIKAANRTFRGRQEISVTGSGDLYYTTDGSEPTTKSQRFTQSFFINTDTTVKAFAVATDGRRSLVVTARYHRIPHDWKITLQSNYSSQYTGGGDLALIDGIRGTTNWSGGAWQGYQGKDLIALVDLGEVQEVSTVGAGFLQDIGSWIWMPSRVEVELSIDGKTFGPPISITNDVSEKREGAITRELVKSIAPKSARYVRIRAVNFGKIPAWHPGSGGDAWIFADEVIVEK
ncbi:MAG TPA: GH92 family glycosyl hydrolase [Pyrinomonadaceae bacterium]|nr:GH92 family glycosyl hydrolase [Pyrinomonadaceae bacterium]